jgi:hypothetical protein
MVTSVLPSIWLDELLHFIDRLCQTHTAFVTRSGFFELALAATACMDLRLHNPERTTERFCSGFRFRRIHNRLAVRHRHAELFTVRPWLDIRGCSFLIPSERAICEAEANGE